MYMWIYTMNLFMVILWLVVMSYLEVWTPCFVMMSFIVSCVCVYVYSSITIYMLLYLAS